jgi:hypothetical protein
MREASRTRISASLCGLFQAMLLAAEAVLRSLWRRLSAAWRGE